MSEFADALGLPDTIRHAAWRRDSEGKPILKDGRPERGPERDYKLAPPDQLEVMGRWEQYLEHQAWHALQRRYPGHENAAILQAKEMELNVSIVAGDYSYFSPAAMKAMSSVMSAGFRKFIYFCLCPHMPSEREAEWIAEEFAIEQRQALYRLQRQAAGVADPKAEPAVAGQQDANGSPPSLPNSSTPGSLTQPSSAA